MSHISDFFFTLENSNRRWDVRRRWQLRFASLRKQLMFLRPCSGILWLIFRSICAHPRPEQLLRRITPANVSFNDYVSSSPHYSGLGMRTVKRSAPVVDDLCQRGENDVLPLLWTLGKRKLRRIQCFEETLVFSTSLIDSAPASTYLQLTAIPPAVDPVMQGC
jgi:hypothetical protein